MLTSLLATSDLAREVAARRYADAGKLMHAPCRAALLDSRSAGCSRRFPTANWRQPSGQRPNPSLQNRMRTGDHLQFSPRLPWLARFPRPPTSQPIDLESAVDQTDDGLLCPDRKSTRLNSSHRCISYAVF